MRSRAGQAGWGETEEQESCLAPMHGHAHAQPRSTCSACTGVCLAPARQRLPSQELNSAPADERHRVSGMRQQWHHACMHGCSLGRTWTQDRWAAHGSRWCACRDVTRGAKLGYMPPSVAADSVASTVGAGQQNCAWAPPAEGLAPAHLAALSPDGVRLALLSRFQ